MVKFRIEKDSLGETKVGSTKLWGAQTQRSCLLYTSPSPRDDL